MRRKVASFFPTHRCSSAPDFRLRDRGVHAWQLDAREGIAEVFRSDPAFEAPESVWLGLQRAAPDLFG